MRRRISTFLILFMIVSLITITGYAKEEEVYLKYIKKDVGNMNIISASEGRILFKKDNKYGFLDYNGEVIIQPQYKYAHDFKSAVAEVFQEDKGRFYIDKAGQEVFNLSEIKEKLNSKYDIRLDEFYEGLAKVTNYPNIAYINTKGEIVIPLIYKQGRNFSDGLAYVSDKQGKYYINKLGKKIITLNNDDRNYYYDFKDGLAKYLDKDKNKYGFINKKGEVQIEALYSNIGDFSEGYAVFTQKSKNGLINKEGKVVIQPEFKQIDNFSNGMTFVYDGIYTVVLNHNLKPVFQLNGYFSNNYKNNFISLNYSQGVGIVDKDGYLRGDFFKGYNIGDGIFFEEEKQLLKVQNLVKESTRVNQNINIYKEYSYIFIDKNGQEILKLDQYDEVYPFYEGRAKVKKGDLYGFIDKKGKVVISIKYSNVSDFKDGKVSAYDDKDYYYIDKSGKRLEEKVYEQSYQKKEDNYEGTAIIIKQESYITRGYGLVDKDNELLLKPIYDSIRKKEKGIYLVKKDRKEGFYNVKNNGSIINIVK